MKAASLSVFSILILCLFLFGSKQNKIANNELAQTLQGNGFALVELFTSEGCSSCPSADALITRLSKQNMQNVFVLSYHVDYWNRLGWEDIYSSALWTKRQQEYVQHFNLNGAYTPQIVVNGKQEFVGSNRSKLYAVVEEELQQKNILNINATATLSENKISVNYNSSAFKNGTLHFVLVQLNAKTQVQRGENEGKLLQHINIVKDVITVNTNNYGKSIDFFVSQHFVASQHKVIAFLQDDKSYNVLAVSDCSIN